MYALSLLSFQLCPRRISSTMVKTRKQTKITPAERAKLNAARDFLIEHFERNPSFTEVATHVGLSPFHFHRRYSLCFDETPKDLVDRMRIEKAKQLLLAGSGPAEVAKKLGYSHQSHLTSVFARAVGTPPARWVKRRQK